MFFRACEVGARVYSVMKVTEKKQWAEGQLPTLLLVSLPRSEHPLPHLENGERNGLFCLPL